MNSDLKDNRPIVRRLLTIESVDELKQGDIIVLPTLGEGRVRAVLLQHIVLEDPSGKARKIPKSNVALLTYRGTDAFGELEQFLRSRIGELFDYSQVLPVKGNARETHFFYIRDVTHDEAARVLQQTNVDLTGMTYLIDSSAISHAIKEHGESTKAIGQGEVPLSRDDFVIMGELLDEPDRWRHVGISQDKLVRLELIKRLEYDYVYIVEVRPKRGDVAGVTLRKYPIGKGNTGLDDTSAQSATAQEVRR